MKKWEYPSPLSISILLPFNTVLFLLHRDRNPEYSRRIWKRTVEMSNRMRNYNLPFGKYESKMYQDLMQRTFVSDFRCKKLYAPTMS